MKFNVCVHCGKLNFMFEDVQMDLLRPCGTSKRVAYAK